MQTKVETLKQYTKQSKQYKNALRLVKNSIDYAKDVECLYLAGGKIIGAKFINDLGQKVLTKFNFYECEKIIQFI